MACTHSPTPCIYLSYRRCCERVRVVFVNKYLVDEDRGIRSTEGHTPAQGNARVSACNYSLTPSPLLSC
jgi:hypothetical protein